MYSRDDLTRDIRSVYDEFAQGSAIISRAWVVQAVLNRHDDDAPNRDGYWYFASVSFTHNAVREFFNELRRREDDENQTEQLTNRA